MALGSTWITAVAAMDPNRVIGRANRLPWHLPGDLAWFRTLTSGGTVIMGRKTCLSIGRALPRRRNLVLTRGSGEGLPSGVETVSSLESLGHALESEEKAFVIGGSAIYGLTLSLWDEVYLTRVKAFYDGDAFFPAFETAFGKPTKTHEDEEFDVLRYLRP